MLIAEHGLVRALLELQGAGGGFGVGPEHIVGPEVVAPVIIRNRQLPGAMLIAGGQIIAVHQAAFVIGPVYLGQRAKLKAAKRRAEPGQ